LSMKIFHARDTSTFFYFKRWNDGKGFVVRRCGNLFLFGKL
jgi:hypothetical protein